MKSKIFSPDCLPDSVPSLRQRLSQGVRAETISVPAAVPIVTLDVSDFVAACENRDPNTGRNALDAIDLILQVGFEQFGEHSCQECQGTGSVIETDPFCPEGGLRCGACGGAGKRRHSPSDPGCACQTSSSCRISLLNCAPPSTTRREVGHDDP